MTNLKPYATQIAIDPDQALHLVHKDKTACGYNLSDLAALTGTLDLNEPEGFCADCFDDDHIDSVREDLAADDAINYVDDTLLRIQQALAEAGA